LLYAFGWNGEGVWKKLKVLKQSFGRTRILCFGGWLLSFACW